MKLLRISLLTYAIILSFSSCTNQKAESTLLTDKQSCSLEDCPSPPTKIEGSLAIEADAGAYQLNMDKSDLIEIGGKCSDLGVRANRILVQVYEGEDTSLPPYVDNESSVNCVNSTTPSNNGQRCFWLTQGRGVIDSGLEYPQCFNGRFSFSVKVGRLLRTVDSGPGAVLDEVANPRRKYLVRFKLRTTDGAISESAWNSTLIERGVSKPTFSQDSLPESSYKCDIKINAFKNLASLTNVTYEIRYTPEYINGVNGTEVLVTPIPMSYTEPVPASPTTHVTNYRINNVIPGVKFKAKVKAFDEKYTYALLPTPGVTHEESPFSDELMCGYQRPLLQRTGGTDATLGTVYTGPTTSTCANSLKSCSVSLSFPAILTGSLEWVVIKGKNSFEEAFEPSVPLPACNSGIGTSTVEGCTFTTSTTSLSYTFKPEFYPKNTCTGTGVGTNTYNGTYGIAVRYVNSATEKGMWSSSDFQPVTCTWSQ